MFFSSDPANPDTFPHFYADMEMYAFSMSQADPATWLLQYVSWEAATKENKWQGRNISRWRNAEYDAAYNAAQSSSTRSSAPPCSSRPTTSRCPATSCRSSTGGGLGVSNTLVAPRSGWDNDLSFLPEWSRQT